MATGMFVVSSTAQPGAGRVVMAISTMLRTVAPITAPAARRGQRSLAKYVSTATARASSAAVMKYSRGSVPAPAYSGRLRTRKVNSPAKNSDSAKL